MTEDSNLHGSYSSAARSDADVDLLQRSINHVEYLLDRLELGAVPASQNNGGSVDSETAAAATGPDTRASTQTGGSHTVAGNLPLDAQTDALRATLEAHEEASRIRAQAAAMHAKVVAERERLFIAVQQLYETLRADAIYESAPGAGNLQAAGQVQTDATERDARNRVGTSVAEIEVPADAVRLLVHDFPGLVARLSDALACLQELTSAIGAENGERSSTNALDAFSAVDSPADETAGHGRAPTANRATGLSCRIARR